MAVLFRLSFQTLSDDNINLQSGISSSLCRCTPQHVMGILVWVRVSVLETPTQLFSLRRYYCIIQRIMFSFVLVKKLIAIKPDGFSPLQPKRKLPLVRSFAVHQFRRLPSLVEPSTTLRSVTDFLSCFNVSPKTPAQTTSPVTIKITTINRSQDDYLIHLYRLTRECVVSLLDRNETKKAIIVLKMLMTLKEHFTQFVFFFNRETGQKACYYSTQPRMKAQGVLLNNRISIHRHIYHNSFTGIQREIQECASPSFKRTSLS